MNVTRTLVLMALLLSMVSTASAQQADRLMRRFKQLDKNGDGRLTRDEVPRAQTFRQLDLDGDGSVTPEEARKALAQARPKQGDDAAPDVKMKTEKDVTYRDIDGAPRGSTSLDIYTPVKPEHCPVMVYVHGGGWAKGDKNNVGAKPAHFVDQGWIFVSVNYRLVPTVEHPDNVLDVAHALAWVHNHIARRGGDPSKIFLMGHSAGAHLVALVATDGRRLKTAGKDLSILKGVVPLDTAGFDIVEKMKTTRGSGKLYTTAFGKDPAVWADASPSSHVARGKSIPPFFIVYVGNTPDRRAQSEDFAKALENADVAVKLLRTPEKNHATVNREFGLKDDKVTGAVQAWLDGLVK